MNLTSLILDLSQIIIQKRRELVHVINPGLLNLSSGTDKVTDQQQLEFKAELEKHSLDKMGWLNTNLSLSLWKLGKRLNEEAVLNQNAAIHDISIQLAEKHGNIFSEIDLHTMAKFAELFPDRNIALGLSMLVRWEYFPVLLSLSDPQAIFFYAKLTTTNGLSLLDLQNHIANKAYEQTIGAKETEKDMIYALQNPTTKTKVTKKGNATVVTTTTYIDDSTVINPDVINIFKNPSLLILSPIHP